MHEDRRSSLWLAAALAGMLGLSLPAATAQGDDLLQAGASWRYPAATDVRAELATWLDERDVDGQLAEQLETLWPPESEFPGVMLLERVATVLALADERAAEVVSMCQLSVPPIVLPAYEWLDDADVWPLLRNNVRLFYGRWLAQHELYDEAHRKLADLEPHEVVDPASLLFYQAIVHHRLLEREECLERVSRLLEKRERIPQRYRTVAELMEADIKPLEEDSLDEIARLMDDIRRRLRLGRAGARVREQEDEVIAKLDKMIEEMEQQQQQAAAAAAAAAGGSPPNAPQDDSIGGSERGPGHVNPRDLGDGTDWGNLPPRERQEALQQMTEELPAHYREVIEEYFRRLARDAQ